MKARKSTDQKVQHATVFLASREVGRDRRTRRSVARGRATRRSPFYVANPKLSDAENLALLASVLGDQSKCPDGCTLHLLPGRYVLPRSLPTSAR